MSEINGIIHKWRDEIVLLSVVLALVVFLTGNSHSSGKAEQLLSDISARQGEQSKSLNEFKTETLHNKEMQDGINRDVKDALSGIINANAKTVAVLRALTIDHAKLMKIHNLYPEQPVDFNQENIKIPEKQIQVSGRKMKPFPQ